MSSTKFYSEPINDFLSHQTVEEAVSLLDETLKTLVIHTEYVGLSDDFVSQYLVI